MITTLFVDTSVLLVAFGTSHPQRTACQNLVRAAHHSQVRLHISAETVQEFLFHRMRRGSRIDALVQARALRTSAVCHPLDDHVLDSALALIEQTRIRERDAMMAATALLHGFDTIVSLDRDFEGIPGLRRVDPADALT